MSSDKISFVALISSFEIIKLFSNYLDIISNNFHENHTSSGKRDMNNTNTAAGI